MRIVIEQLARATREIDRLGLLCVDRPMGLFRSKILSRFTSNLSSNLSLSKTLLGVLTIGLVVFSVGCGGKDKKKKTTPDGPVQSAGKGSATTEDPANIDPDNGFGDPGSSEPGDSIDPGSDPDTSDPGTPRQPPEIKPPGLDLTPAQKAAKVRHHVGRGKAALQGNSPDADAAISEARLALSADETSVSAMLLLAQADIIKRYYDQALDVLRKAVKRGGAQNRQVHFLTGLVYDKTNRPDDAVNSYERAVALAPNYQSALMNLGVHYLANQRFLEAGRIYERLTKQLGYTSAAAWNNLGSSYRGQSAAAGLSEVTRNQLILRAETTYKRAISANKNYAAAYYNLGLLYLDSDPFPAGRGQELDRLIRLQRAKTYFDEYRLMPGADTKRVDEVAATAQKLIAREQRLRKKAEERRKRKAAQGNN